MHLAPRCTWLVEGAGVRKAERYGDGSNWSDTCWMLDSRTYRRINSALQSAGLDFAPEPDISA